MDVNIPTLSNNLKELRMFRPKVQKLKILDTLSSVVHNIYQEGGMIGAGSGEVNNRGTIKLIEPAFIIDKLIKSLPNGVGRISVVALCNF